MSVFTIKPAISRRCNKSAEDKKRLYEGKKDAVHQDVHRE